MTQIKHRLVLLLGLVALAAVSVQPAGAMVYYADGTDNTSAPSGGYADSGWQWQGSWGAGSGTAISSKHFLTSKHFDSGSGIFTLSDGSQYNYDSAIGYIDDPTSDLRIVTIEESFSSWAPLYLNSDQQGKALVVFGRGWIRGSEVTVDSTLKGWTWSSSGSGTRRWGTNIVSGFADSDSLLIAEFDADPSKPNEAALTSGDSGGGLFIKDGDLWKLAGVNYAVDGPFDLDNDHTSGVFSASLFDRGGLYQKIGDPDVWTYINDSGVDKPSILAASSISSHDSWIYDNIRGPLLLPGDANGDHLVSADDFASVQTHFGDSGAAGIAGDANGDSMVSADDYASVQTNFGKHLPEPTTLGLLLLGGLALLRRRWA